MKNRYRSEQELTKVLFEQTSIPKELTEKRFMMEFLNKLPIEELKKLTSFTETDPDNEESWNTSNEYELEKLDMLQSRGLIRYECEIFI